MVARGLIQGECLSYIKETEITGFVPDGVIRGRCPNLAVLSMTETQQWVQVVLDEGGVLTLLCRV